MHTRTIPGYLSCLVCLFLALPVQAAPADWSGEWKINDPTRYHSITIENVTAEGFSFYYDEGIGMNGHSINGTARFVDANSATAVIDDNTSKTCTLTIKMEPSSRGNTLSLLGCSINHYYELTAESRFVPDSVKLYYKAGFDCAKATGPVETGICESRVLAAADLLLGSRYKSLRKQLDKSGQKQLRDAQRAWLKARDQQCKAKDKTEFCLRRFYGLRLLQLYVQEKYHFKAGDKPNYALIDQIYRQQNKLADAESNGLMENGLGLWLGGMMQYHLIDLGYFELTTTPVGKQGYIMTGPYYFDRSMGHDPASMEDQIHIEFSKQYGLVCARFTRGELHIYLPVQGAPFSDHLQKWLAEIPVKEKTIHKVF
ncbi:MAG: lysozyme inhibitor LprI family protein [Gammaproteobacteria bacterium]|nr:lysozyme inhibitor LprI family protein [Gammaproteobacteria bacterium]MDH5652206.1 lysozyme inhibitor LprI family protein [Gammaproteobacteria bacterium]